MQIEAAVFRKVQAPLTIEAVDIDKPAGREVLVRTVATGVCHSDLHVVDGIGRFPLDRPIVLGHENSVVRIDPEIPLDRAALVGCGVLTGVGAALRSSGLEPGQTVAVFGCGGVGLSIIQGARIGAARQIIAVDMFPQKEEMAKRAGATHFVNSSEDDPVKAVRALTGGLGVDHAFEAVGNAKLCRQAIESLAIRGTATIVGVLPPDAMIEFPWMAIRPECKVQTSRMGSNRFRTDIPLYLDFYKQGRLHLDEM